MRIRLDRTLCDGFGICGKHAPGYFSLDEWGYASLIGDGTVAEEDRDDVLRALFDCPVHAIIEMSQDEFTGEKRPAAAPAADEEPVFEARWGFAQ
ncbi:ferredoxin [Mycobacterium sp. M26]|uniref:ferredoxin n=1 Tax=Mycobacterium sp. M26 TaxID=1762962 RepID=UPI00073E683C|nr:ferredoxin [Mycobacterium sp. M26]